jgi:dipeptidyl aminopeptidase/acylaminoacyl peptidase
LYATRGYAVLLPDLPLTSTGRVAIDLVKLIVPGVDKVVEMGIADPDGLGVTGHSFGGYNTIALITQTTRFKAALMSAGLANIFSAYGEMSEDGTAYGAAVIEQGQFLVQGTPWEKTEAYLENSPIFHLDRVETPLMITHGAKDSAVAPFLADEIFVGLRRLGKEVLYAKYDNEEHHQAQWTYANQLDHWTRALAWFDQHLKKPSGTAKTPSAALPR